MDKEIRKATMDDLACIMKIYAYARVFMKSHGNPRQWAATNWPPDYDFGANAEKGYLDIEGKWKDDTPYGVVHRIASDGSEKGIGKFCIDWAYGQCHHLRMDTHPDNIVMQNLLKKLGFEKCGIIHVPEDNDPRYAYEKFSR